MTGNDKDKAARETNRFRELTGTYGADPARWPAEDRTWAKAYARDNTGAAAQLREAAQLDAVLDRVSAPQPSAALVGRILAGAPGAAGEQSRARLPGWLFPIWRPAGALTVALFLGLAVGTVAPPSLAGNEVVAEEVDLLDADTPVVAGLDLGERK